MRAKNKIISGSFQEYRFIKRYGKLYLKCLEQEFAVNEMTIKSIQVIDKKEKPSLLSLLLRGYVLSKIFGLLGLVAGTYTAKDNVIYRIKITFPNEEIGLAEVNEQYYDEIVKELFNIIPM